MYEFSGRTLSEAVSKAVYGKPLGEFDARALQRPLHLKRIEKPSDHFPFQRKIISGSTLFVGEGNFSFSLGLAKHKQAEGFRIVSTSFEPEKELSDTAYRNAQKLVHLGARLKLASMQQNWMKRLRQDVLHALFSNSRMSPPDLLFTDKIQTTC